MQIVKESGRKYNPKFEFNESLKKQETHVLEGGEFQSQNWNSSSCYYFHYAKGQYISRLH